MPLTATAIKKWEKSFAGKLLCHQLTDQGRILCSVAGDNADIFEIEDQGDRGEEAGHYTLEGISVSNLQIDGDGVLYGYFLR